MEQYELQPNMLSKTISILLYTCPSNSLHIVHCIAVLSQPIHCTLIMHSNMSICTQNVYIHEGKQATLEKVTLALFNAHLPRSLRSCSRPRPWRRSSCRTARSAACAVERERTSRCRPPPAPTPTPPESRGPVCASTVLVAAEPWLRGGETRAWHTSGLLTAFREKKELQLPSSQTTVGNEGQSINIT